MIFEVNVETEKGHPVLNFGEPEFCCSRLEGLWDDSRSRRYRGLQIVPVESEDGDFRLSAALYFGFVQVEGMKEAWTEEIERCPFCYEPLIIIDNRIVRRVE